MEGQVFAKIFHYVVFIYIFQKTTFDKNVKPVKTKPTNLFVGPLSHCLLAVKNFIVGKLTTDILGSWLRHFSG